MGWSWYPGDVIISDLCFVSVSLSVWFGLVCLDFVFIRFEFAGLALSCYTAFFALFLALFLAFL